MIRKHATSREFKGNVPQNMRSWNKQRYVMLDLQSPLTADGNVRGRIVAGYQNNTPADRYNSEKAFFPEFVDADLRNHWPFTVMNIKKLMSLPT